MEENRKKTLNNKYKFIIYLLVFVLVVGTVFYFIFRKPSTAPGIQYIQNLEAKKIDDVAKKVHRKRVDELMDAVETGKIDTFSLFDDFVFYGDSRAVGWQTYGYLPAARIFAGSGHTILNITEWNETLKELKPSTIYFSYGVNDMGLELDNREGGYGKLYEDQVKEVEKICPDADLFLISIVPASKEAVEKNPSWKYYKEYNKQIESICKKNGWHYIDCTSLADGGNAKIYQQDGIHYYSLFYNDWAKAIIKATQEVQA